MHARHQTIDSPSTRISNIAWHRLSVQLDVHFRKVMFKIK